MKQTATIMGFILLCGCSVSSGYETEGRSAVSKEGLSQKPTVSTDAKNKAIEQLESSLPDWVPANVMRSVNPSRLGPPLTRPREIARILTDEPLEFRETRSNGREIFKDKDGKLTVKSDPGRGYWKLISTPPYAKKDSTEFSIEDAENRTRELFDSFNLPREEIGRVFASNVGGLTSDGVVDVDERHVRILRSVNSTKVRDSRLMVSYGLDGSPLRVEVRWPRFVLKKAGKLLTREQAVDELSDKIGKYFENGKKPYKVDSQLTYYFDEQQEMFEPVVTVFIYYSEYEISPEEIEYSLISGLKDEHDPRSDDGDDI